jgi:glycosyltransferase involved in cell wall biosynthesis
VKRPRLLFVSPRFLFPMDQGGKIRTGNILRHMKGGVFDVTLASPAPTDHTRFATEIDAACNDFRSWPQVASSRIRRVTALASHLPVAAATDRSKAGRAVVRQALADGPDVVVVDFPHADALMPSQIDGASVMFTHNVEAEIFERQLERSTGIWRLIWADQSRKMARLERKCLSRYDTVISVSDRDNNALSQRYRLRRVETIATGVDVDFYGFSPPETALDPGISGGTLVFIATMSWAANVDGVHFLLDKVFPLLLRARPHVRAVIIGRDPPAAILEKINRHRLNVTLTGFVDDVRRYVAQANVYVIPLFVGSGTRIKAYEAMAMGRPVVSTSVGVEGLDVTHGENFLRADDAEGFARCILMLLENSSMRTRIASAARQLMEDRFSWDRVARQFEAICEGALARRNAQNSTSKVT